MNTAMKRLNQVRAAIKMSQENNDKIAEEGYQAELEAITEEEVQSIKDKAKDIGTVKVLRNNATGEETPIDDFVSSISNIASSRTVRLDKMSQNIQDGEKTQKFINMIAPSKDKTEDQLNKEKIQVIRETLADLLDKDPELFDDKEIESLIIDLRKVKEIIIEEARTSKHTDASPTLAEIGTYLRHAEFNDICKTLGDNIIDYIFDGVGLAENYYKTNRKHFIQEVQMFIITFDNMDSDSDVIIRYIEDAQKTMDLLGLIGTKLNDILITNKDIFISEVIKDAMDIREDTSYLDNSKSIAHLNVYTQDIILGIYLEEFEKIKGDSELVDDMFIKEIEEIEFLCKAYREAANAKTLIKGGIDYLTSQKKPLSVRDMMTRMDQMIKTVSKSKVKISFPGYNPDMRNVKAHNINAIKKFTDDIIIYNEKAEELNLVNIPEKHIEPFVFSLAISMTAMIKKLTKRKTYEEYALPMTLNMNTYSSLDKNLSIMEEMYNDLKETFDNICINK